ncbi:MAG: glycosyltransferase family 4 protein [Candidatus Doudnabacteria bacterium]|nr:glycosyltransferase family 4 protein [Candidatus Doudnabacteria bacterium]
MRIGLEAERANLPNPTGVERYAAELIRNLAKLDSKNQYVLYFRTKPQDWFKNLGPNFKLRIIPFPKFWTQLRISWEMIIHPVDVLSILASALPIQHPKNSVVTVHDIAFEFFPEAFTWFMRNYQIWSSRYAVRCAVKIVTPSESTRQDLIKHYKADPNKVVVIPLAADRSFMPIPYDRVQPMLDKFRLVYKKYILFVGTLQPRKNIIRLIDAFIKLKKENRIEEKLVLTGGKGWLWEPIMKKISEAGLSGDVVHLGYVDNNDLPALYNGAVLLTLPALYEGFGLPPLEAMQCGTPVVVSNISSLPEVVGDAGKLVDPNSVDSIAEGLLEVLSDGKLRGEMGERGIRQAGKFTWQETARKTLALFESLKSS